MFKLLLNFIPTGLPILILFGPLRFKWWTVGSAAGANKGLSVIINRAEKKQLELITQYSRDITSVFDIGANVGLFTLAVSCQAQKVYAFEPYPRNIFYLFKNLSLNKISNVNIVPCAVGKTTHIGFFQPGTNNATGKLSKFGIQPTSVIALDDFCESLQIKPDLIKVDIEGAEYDFLLGAKKSLANNPPLFISFHSQDLQIKCFKLLKRCGYTHFKEIEEDESYQNGEYLVYR